MMNNKKKEIDGLGLKFGDELVSNNMEIWEIPSEFLPIEPKSLYKVTFKFSESETQKDKNGRPIIHNKVSEIKMAPKDITKKYKQAKKYLREALDFLYDDTKY